MLDLNQIFPMKPSAFEINISVESFDKKNCRHLYDTEKRIVLKQSEKSIANFDSIISRFVSKSCQKSLSLSSTNTCQGRAGSTRGGSFYIPCVTVEWLPFASLATIFSIQIHTFK